MQKNDKNTVLFGLFFVYLQHLCVDAMRKLKRMVGIHILKSVYYGALFFDSLNCLANKKRVSQNQSNSRCSWVCKRMPTLRQLETCMCVSLHTCVGFCVALP